MVYRMIIKSISCTMLLHFCGALSDTKVILSSLGQRVNRGFSAKATDQAEARQLVAKLEQNNLCPNPLSTYLNSDESDFSGAEAASILGRWRLIYTDAPDILGLGFLPVLCGQINQNVRLGPSTGKLVLENTVAIQPLGNDLLQSVGLGGTVLDTLVIAEAEVLDSRRVGLVFNDGRLEPRRFLGLDVSALPAVPLPVVSLPSAILTSISKAIGRQISLETTYLDSEMRVGRSPREDIFVLVRDDI